MMPIYSVQWEQALALVFHYLFIFKKMKILLRYQGTFQLEVFQHVYPLFS